MTRRLLGVLAATLVLLAACGDDDDGGEGGGAAVSFCDQARVLQERFDEVAAGGLQGDLLETIRDEVADLDPPAEIEDDFERLLEGFDLFVEEFSDADLSDPATLARFGELEEELAAFEEAGANVTTYLQEECGIETAPTETTEGG